MMGSSSFRVASGLGPLTTGDRIDIRLNMNLVIFTTAEKRLKVAPCHSLPAARLPAG